MGTGPRKGRAMKPLPSRQELLVLELLKGDEKYPPDIVAASDGKLKSRPIHAILLRMVRKDLVSISSVPGFRAIYRATDDGKTALRAYRAADDVFGERRE